MARPTGSSGARQPGPLAGTGRAAQPARAGARPRSSRAGRKRWWTSTARRGLRVCAILKCRCFWSITYRQIQQKWTLLLSSRCSDGSCATKGKVSSLRETSGGCTVLSSLLFGPKHRGFFPVMSYILLDVVFTLRELHLTMRNTTAISKE